MLRQIVKLLVTAGCEPAATQKTGTITSTGTIVRGRETNKAKKVEVTLTGTGGTANITVNGIAYLATYTGGSLANTAAAFVVTHGATLLALGITVTSLLDVIIFTGTPGVGFTCSDAVNASVDLAGVAAVTQAMGIITDFATDVHEGDYIYNNNQGAGGHEVRRVTVVYARPNSVSQRFDIDRAFTADIPEGSTLQIVKARWKKAKIVNIGAGNAKFNNVAFEPGDAAKIEVGGELPENSVEPFTFDGTGGNDIQATLEE